MLWERTSALTPVRNAKTALVWDEARRMLVLVCATPGLLTAWHLEEDEWRCHAGASVADIAEVAAVYLPTAGEVGVFASIRRYDGGSGPHGWASSLAAWKLGSRFVPWALQGRLPSFEADSRLCACFDRQRQRVILAEYQHLWSLSGETGVDLGALETNAAVSSAAYDQLGERVLLAGPTGIRVLQDATLVELCRTESWMDRSQVVAMADLGCLALFGSGEVSAAVVLKGEQAEPLADVVPPMQSCSIAFEENRRILLATTEMASATQWWRVTPGAGRRAWRPLGPELASAQGRMVGGAALLYVDGSAGRVYRRQERRWVLAASPDEGSPSLHDKGGLPALRACAQDAEGRLWVYTEQGELFALSVAGGWSCLAVAAGGPGPRAGSALVCTTRGLVLFGGSTRHGRSLGDTWRFADGAWTKLTTAHSPPKRADAWGLPVGHGERVLLWGGEIGFGYTGRRDIWIFDGVDWSQVGTLGEDHRTYFAAVDPAADRVLEIGYASGLGGVCLRTWSGAGWEVLTPLVPPPPEPLLPSMPAEAADSCQCIWGYDPGARAAVAVSGGSLVGTYEAPLRQLLPASEQA